MADGSVITTTKARPKLGQSPQSRWQRKMQAAGKCRACGEPRPPELKQLCRPCQDKASAYMKLYRLRKKEKRHAVVGQPLSVVAGRPEVEDAPPVSEPSTGE